MPKDRKIEIELSATLQMVQFEPVTITCRDSATLLEGESPAKERAIMIKSAKKALDKELVYLRKIQKRLNKK